MASKFYARRWFKLLFIICLISISVFILQRYVIYPVHPNLILITLDTVRADHLSCYGYEYNTSPFIDSIAQQGVLFLNAYAQIPLTLPSHTAILTSTYPKNNGVRLNGSCYARDELITIAELLKHKNYSTFAIIGGFPLDSRFGLSQGFDVYDDRLEGEPEKEAKYWYHHKFLKYERRANEVTDRAIAVLEKIKKGEKFFLWLHYFDPHWKYRPPEKFKAQFKLHYDGEIAFVDSELKRFFEYVTKRELIKNSLVVIASDHGEGLYEHGEEGHGWELFNSTLKIPLIFYYPKVLPSNITVENICQSIDILPTVLDIMGIQPPSSFEGRNLLPLIKEPDNQSINEFIFAESNKPKVLYANRARYAVIDGNFKLIAYYNENDKVVVRQLFNLKQDAKELKNVADAYPDVVKKLSAEIDKFFIPASKNFAFFKANQEIFEKMKALGYID
jgi:arylsulfatase A-like enzyme